MNDRTALKLHSRLSHKHNNLLSWLVHTATERDMILVIASSLSAIQSGGPRPVRIMVISPLITVELTLVLVLEDMAETEGKCSLIAEETHRSSSLVVDDGFMLLLASTEEIVW